MPCEPHAFTAPLGLDKIPVTRAHVRLLGPCFKTGRESTRSGSAADWSGLCPRTPGTNSLPGSGGVTRATQHPESSPESLPQRVGRSLLARRGSRPLSSFNMKTVGGRSGDRGPRAPLTRASAEAPPVSVPGLRPLRPETPPTGRDVQKLWARSAPRRGFRPRTAGAPDSHRSAPCGATGGREHPVATARGSADADGAESPLLVFRVSPVYP